MIGAFRYQIEILAETRMADEAGGASRAFAPTAQVWAAVELLPSVAAIGDDRARRLRRLSALVRSRMDWAIGGRIRFDGADYEIVSIESDDERGRRVFLICEEAAP
ncbi:MAG: head-tail adaptor protein [Parvularculaceae bacterium]|nr:head-tail adaptor protein [Parvularculaceae bacterium]